MTIFKEATFYPLSSSSSKFIYHFFTIGCSSHLMAKEPGSTRAISACSLIDDGVHFVHVELVAESL